MTTTQQPRITISETTAALAQMIQGGGSFSYDLVAQALNVHRDTLNASLWTLEDLGAITYTKSRRGRPPKGSTGPAFTVKIHPKSWVWSAISTGEAR